MDEYGSQMRHGGQELEKSIEMIKVLLQDSMNHLLVKLLLYQKVK
jgi:hypothetical protein